jgi:hypothetical protein
MSNFYLPTLSPTAHLYGPFNVWTGSLTRITRDTVMKSAGMAKLEAALILRANAHGLAEIPVRQRDLNVADF